MYRDSNLYTRVLLYSFWENGGILRGDNESNPDDTTLSWLTANDNILNYRFLQITFPGIGDAFSWPEYYSSTRHHAYFSATSCFINNNNIPHNNVNNTAVDIRIDTASPTKFCIYRIRRAALISTNGVDITSTMFNATGNLGVFYGIR